MEGGLVVCVQGDGKDAGKPLSKMIQVLNKRLDNILTLTHQFLRCSVS